MPETISLIIHQDAELILEGGSYVPAERVQIMVVGNWENVHITINTTRPVPCGKHRISAPSMGTHTVLAIADPQHPNCATVGQSGGCLHLIPGSRQDAEVCVKLIQSAAARLR